MLYQAIELPLGNQITNKNIQSKNNNDKLQYG